MSHNADAITVVCDVPVLQFEIILCRTRVKTPVDTGECHMMGFEPLINQRLLPPTFPRYTTIRSREETIDYFAGLVQRLSQFAGIVPLSDNLHALIVSLFISLLYALIVVAIMLHFSPEQSDTSMHQY